jgi:hypothetical protein
MSADPSVMQVAAPPPASADAAYSPVVLPQTGGPRSGTAAFGGEGGPRDLPPPPAESKQP